MDLIQVTAYPAMGALMVQCTTARTTEEGRGWSHRILEQVDVPEGLTDDWDLIWLVGQVLQDRALRYSREAPFTDPDRG